jgi:hypothetical protein
MTSDDAQNDPVLSALRELHSCDVGQLRAHRLRIRCHATFLNVRRAPDTADMADGEVWRRVVVPALLGAWCAIYVVEVMRHAAAIYGL